MISFIIPVYNGEEKIERCIFSILNQKSNIPYEIVVVDDGSKDNTSQIVQSICDTYFNVHYIFQENGGVSSARNNGLNHSQGEYVVFVDTDDFIEDSFFDSIDLSEKEELYIYGYNYIDENGRKNIIHLENQIIDKKDGIVKLYNGRLFNPVWNKIYKKSKIKRFFQNDFVMGEDLLFNIHYFKNIDRIKIIDKPLYNYCVNNGSVTKNYKFKYIVDFIQIYYELKDFLSSIEHKDFSQIEVDLVDNIVGTIFMLVNGNVTYSHYKEEMKKIYQELPKELFVFKSNNRISNLIFLSLKHRFFFIIFMIIKFKFFVKKLYYRLFK